MKLVRVAFGFFEVHLRISWRPLSKQIEIRKYDGIPKDFLPDIKRVVLSRLKARFRSQREKLEAIDPDCCVVSELNSIAPIRGSSFPSPGTAGFLGKKYLRTGRLSHSERN